MTQLESGSSPQTPKLEVTLFESYEIHTGLNRETGDPIYTDSRQEDKDRGVSQSALARIREVAQREQAVIQELYSKQDSGLRFYDLGETIRHLATVTLAFGGVSGLIAALRGTQPAILQWLKNRGDRSVTVEVGDVKVSVRVAADLDKAIEAAEKLRDASIARKLSDGVS